jgi:hypothetical protein
VKHKAVQAEVVVNAVEICSAAVDCEWIVRLPLSSTNTTSKQSHFPYSIVVLHTVKCETRHLIRGTIASIRYSILSKSSWAVRQADVKVRVLIEPVFTLRTFKRLWAIAFITAFITAGTGVLAFVEHEPFLALTVICVRPCIGQTGGTVIPAGTC